MLHGYKLFDADAHTMMSPRMWETLPDQYRARRPRPTRVHDALDLGRWTNGWLVEGQLIPHALGPGSQPGNEPARVLEEFGAESGHEAFPLSSFDLSDPAARLRTMDFMGVDHKMLYPTTLYARMSRDPGFEAALMRSYNRYVGRQCQSFPKRLKWAGLLPLRDARQGLAAIEEMAKLGATAAVVYGTAGERLLCDPSFAPVWDELHRAGLPLCVHMGMSYPPFLEVCNGLLAAHGIGTGKIRPNFYRWRSRRSNAARRNRFAGRGSNSLLLRSAARRRPAPRGEGNSCPPRHKRFPKAQDSLRQRGQVLRRTVARRVGEPFKRFSRCARFPPFKNVRGAKGQN